VGAGALAPRRRRSSIMYLIAFPLLLIPFALFNMIAFLLNLPFTDTLFSIPLIEGRRLAVTTSDVLLAIAILLIYVEAIKASRVRKAVMDHVLSFILFAAMVAELVLVPRATTPTLLLLAVLGLADVLIGLSVATRPKQQEIVTEDGYQQDRY
jgi:hypothetical protein